MPSKILQQVKSAIRSQGLKWEAGTTSVGESFEAGTLPGLGFNYKGKEPSGGKGKLPNQTFAFQSASPPTEINWGTVNGQNWISSIRDQGQCGACVAFATCATLESRIKLLKQDSHFPCELSVAHLFYCGAGENACDEGWQIGLALKRCKDHGIGLESDFRYNLRLQNCQEITPVVKVPRWRRAFQYVGEG